MENFWNTAVSFFKLLWFFLVSAFLATLNYFEPIVNFIVAISMMFIFDLLLGIITGKKFYKEKISFTKGFSAIILFGVYVTIVAVLYILGNLMCDELMMSYVIKTVSWATIYLYSINITKNLKRLFPKSKLIAFLDYFLNAEFLDNFPSLKSFLKKSKIETEDKNKNSII